LPAAAVTRHISLDKSIGLTSAVSIAKVAGTWSINGPVHMPSPTGPKQRPGADFEIRFTDHAGRTAKAQRD
jgi:hypothetical protein